MAQAKVKKAQTLSEKDIITLMGEYFIFKAKTFSQNSVFDKHKAAVFLSMSYKFKSFRELGIFCNQATRLGILSAANFRGVIKLVEYFVRREGHFAPSMSEKDYTNYFFNLTKKYKISTIQNHYRCASLFLRFLMSKGIPATDIKTIKMSFLKDKKLPSFLNDFQYKQFLNEVKKLKEKSLKQKRDKLALILVSYTGIRRRELANITLNDIQDGATSYKIKIKGKCAQERFVSIKKEFVGNLLNDYLKQKQEQGLNTPYVFSRNNRPNTQLPVAIKPILEKIQAIQQRGNGLHLLRHSFASFVYRESKDILLTQEVLGHTSISNTQIYVHLNRDAHEQVSNFF